MKTHTINLTAINAKSDAPYTVNNISGATNNRLPDNSPWLPSNFSHGGSFNGITTSGGTPYISASSFKARLRSAAVDRQTGYKNLTGEDRFSYADLFGLIKGGKMINQTGVNAQRLAKALIDIRNQNPIMGLFGGAFPSFMPSAIQIGNLYAIHDEGLCIESSSGVRHSIEDDVIEHISDADQRGAAAELQANANSSIKEIKERFKALKKVALTKEDKNDLIQREKEELEQYSAMDAVNDQQLVEPYWQLPRGVRFEQTISSNSIRDYEIGLLIESMQDFQKTPILGARAGSTGAGARLTGIDWQITIDGVDCGTVANPTGAALLALYNHEAMDKQFSMEAIVQSILEKPEPKAKEPKAEKKTKTA